MNEVRAPDSQAPGPSAGALLRHAREAAGLHLEALAVSLKVPIPKLEALEQDRHELLTDTVFVRALAASVCRTLKIDPQPVLERLPQTAHPRLVRDTDGINRVFRTPNDATAPAWRQQLGRPVYLAVLVLLLGALVLILLPGFQGDLVQAPVATADSGKAAAGPVRTAAEPPALPPAAESVTTVLAPGMAVVVPNASSALVTPGVVVPASTELAAAPVSAGAIVVFRTSGPSWVEVTDARGAVAVSKMLTAGEATGVSGALPLQVTVGRADITQVQVRGKPFDLKPVSRDNVARFEVK